ncbi:uncharacterized protein LOC105698920 [Orussus abietinus]|uniref:uncharacterized protein LOC105698920 n=1 Tax=Orussus abietinus TaxID=222816 RepID=UPI000625574B|nr:uncharacterized protein LOC105698920 [Orussus abietinus]
MPESPMDIKRARKKAKGKVAEATMEAEGIETTSVVEVSHDNEKVKSKVGAKGKKHHPRRLRQLLRSLRVKLPKLSWKPRVLKLLVMSKSPMIMKKVKSKEGIKGKKLKMTTLNQYQ